MNLCTRHCSLAAFSNSAILLKLRLFAEQARLAAERGGVANAPAEGPARAAESPAERFLDPVSSSRAAAPVARGCCWICSALHGSLTFNAALSLKRDLHGIHKNALWRARMALL